MEIVKSTLEMVLKSMVSNPEAVALHVSSESDDHGDVEVINVKVDPSDVGLCIGVGGTTAEALRKIIGNIGFKQLNKRVYVRIDAPKIPKSHFDYQKN